MTTTAEINELLHHTTLPPGLVIQLLDAAPPLWVASNTASTLAGDLALFHPKLQEKEVRARAAAFADGEAWRLTVLAHDRAGLLADTAAVVASSGMSVVSAGAGTWSNLNMALHTLTVRGPLPSQTDWQQFGRRLRTIESAERPSVSFTPSGDATVDVSSEDADRWLLHVRAQDQVGLLWSICCGLAELGLGIQAATIGGADGMADDLFVVDGEPDVDALRDRLSRPRTRTTS